MAGSLQIFKLTDLIGQSILFISFAFALDSDAAYIIVILALGAWQLLSALIHLVLSSIHKQKLERRAYFIIAAIYGGFFYKFAYNVKIKYLTVNIDADNMIKIPVQEAVFITIALLIGFWYYTICFRETKKLFKEGKKIKAQRPFVPMVPSKN